jgi:hypothetical protein
MRRREARGKKNRPRSETCESWAQVVEDVWYSITSTWYGSMLIQPDSARLSFYGLEDRNIVNPAIFILHPAGTRALHI